jgi:eukaryotic-like serine/threonine-protein kinase
VIPSDGVKVSGDKAGPARVGQVIAGRYQVVRLLGAGGMGAVYQARQLSMDTIRVFDYGADDAGQLFLAMEFLEGRPLSRVLDEAGALPLPRLVHIASQVVRALGAAHQEVVKVLDFGIARFVDGDESSKMTHDGAVVGTPAYMSPEQAMGQPVDHRADFYSGQISPALECCRRSRRSAATARALHRRRCRPWRSRPSRRQRRWS